MNTQQIVKDLVFQDLSKKALGKRLSKKQVLFLNWLDKIRNVYRFDAYRVDKSLQNIKN